jgi:hypothetical protein
MVVEVPPDASADETEVDASPADVATDKSSSPDKPGVDVEPDAPPTTCMATNQTGLLSGGVFDDCEPLRAIEAAVGIAGQHTCSVAGKGAYFFSGLPVGCNLTIMAAKPGYLPAQATVVIPADGLASYNIRLKRQDGCTTPAPTTMTCQCSTTGCTWR